MFREARAVLGETLREWQADGAMQWGAALAYYATLSLAPVVLLLLHLVGRIHGDARARAELLEWMGRAFGAQGASVTRTIIESTADTGGLSGLWSGVILLVVATTVFAQLQKAMNEVWGVEWRGGDIRGVLRARGLGFLMVLVLALLFALAVTASTAVTFLAPYVQRLLPGAQTMVVALNLAVSLVVVTLLFAGFFRVLPDVEVAWRDVWVGALVSAVLFLGGNSLLGIYLRATSIGSAYGTAGSLLGLLMWIYYSAQVFFFGAEFTQVWARRYGRAMKPSRGAVATKGPDRQPRGEPRG